MFSAFLGVLWARELGAVGRIVSALQQRIVSCPLPNSFKSVTHRGLVKKTASPNVSTAISDSCRRVQLVVYGVTGNLPVVHSRSFALMSPWRRF